METLLQRNCISSNPYLVTINDDGDEEVSEIPNYEDRLKNVPIITVDDDDDDAASLKKTSPGENAAKIELIEKCKCTKYGDHKEICEILDCDDQVITVEDEDDPAPVPTLNSNSELFLKAENLSAESFVVDDFDKKKLYMFFEDDNYYMETEAVDLNELSSNLNELKMKGAALAMQIDLVKRCSETLDQWIKQRKLEEPEEAKNIFDKFVKNCITICKTKRSLDIEMKEALVISLAFENSNSSLKAAVLSITTEMQYITFHSKDDSVINEDKLNYFRNVAEMILQNWSALKLRGWQVKEMTSEIRNCFFAGRKSIFTSPSPLPEPSIAKNETAESPLDLKKQATRKAHSAKCTKPATSTVASSSIASSQSMNVETAWENLKLALDNRWKDITETISNSKRKRAVSNNQVSANKKANCAQGQQRPNILDSPFQSPKKPVFIIATGSGVSVPQFSAKTQPRVRTKRKKVKQATNVSQPKKKRKRASKNQSKPNAKEERNLDPIVRAKTNWVRDEQNGNLLVCQFQSDEEVASMFNTTKDQSPYFFSFTTYPQNNDVETARVDLKKGTNILQLNRSETILSKSNDQNRSNCPEETDSTRGNQNQTLLVSPTLAINSSRFSVPQFSNAINVSNKNVETVRPNLIQAVNYSQRNLPEEISKASSNEKKMLPASKIQSDSIEKVKCSQNETTLGSGARSANDVGPAFTCSYSSVSQLRKAIEAINSQTKNVESAPPNLNVTVGVNSQSNRSKVIAETISTENSKQPVTKIQSKSILKTKSGALSKVNQSPIVSQSRDPNDLASAVNIPNISAPNKDVEVAPPNLKLTVNVSQSEKISKTNSNKNNEQPASNMQSKSNEKTNCTPNQTLLGSRAQIAKDFPPAGPINSSVPQLTDTITSRSKNAEVARPNLSQAVNNSQRDQVVSKTISNENNKQYEKANDTQQGKQSQLSLVNQSRSANDHRPTSNTTNNSSVSRFNNSTNSQSKNVEMARPNLKLTVNVSRSKTNSNEKNEQPAAPKMQSKSNEKTNCMQNQTILGSRAQVANNFPPAGPINSSVPQLSNTINSQSKNVEMARPNLSQVFSKTISNESNKRNEKANDTQNQLSLINQSRSANDHRPASNTTNNSSVSRFNNITNSQSKNVEMAKPNLSQAVSNLPRNRSKVEVSKTTSNENNKQNEKAIDKQKQLSLVSQSRSANDHRPTSNTTNNSSVSRFNNSTNSQNKDVKMARPNLNRAASGFQRNRPEQSNTFTRNFNNHSPASSIPLPQPKLRPIAIDGTNVAYSYGQSIGKFSFRGVELCVNYFLQFRRHPTVHVFVPPFEHLDVADGEILQKLENERIVVWTPSNPPGSSQFDKRMVDRFICDYAVETGAIIVSNDRLSGLLNESFQYDFIIRNRLLMYTFTRDLFLFPKYPLGNRGPNLDTFLRF